GRGAGVAGAPPKGLRIEWRTTANALYATLKATALEMEVAKSDRWPGDGQRLMRELTNVAPALRELGIEIRRGKRQGRERTRTVVIAHPGAGKSASASVRTNPLKNAEKTSSDAEDAKIPIQGCQPARTKATRIRGPTSASPISSDARCTPIATPRSARSATALTISRRRSARRCMNADNPISHQPPTGGNT